jgi:hypothetical protein
MQRSEEGYREPMEAMVGRFGAPIRRCVEPAMTEDGVWEKDALSIEYCFEVTGNPAEGQLRRYIYFLEDGVYRLRYWIAADVPKD